MHQTLRRFIPLIFLPLAAVLAHAADDGYFRRTLKVSGPVNMLLETGSGSIDVRSGNSAQVEIIGHIKAARGLFAGDAKDKIKRIEANPPIQQSGNDIRIGHLEDPELRRRISISYEVTVPAATRLRSQTGSGSQRIEGIQGPLDVETGSGSLMVTNIGDTVRADTGSGNIEADRIQGNLRAKSGSGSIRATGVAGGLEAEAGSGNITLVQTAAGAVRVDTGSGGIDVRGVRGSLMAKAGSGTIQAEGDPTGAWTVSTGSGSVHLRFPSDKAFDLHARTGSGEISVAPPLTVQGSMQKKEIRGRVRGGGVPVEIETGSGGIRIE